ncbi:Polycystin cation channel, PKD1/PKD2 [Phytophthora cactorum]|nr:Polycystin cation channel, PKD1/PKD2 [Phytophthora cactorum]
MTLATHLFAAALGALVPSFLLILQMEKQWARELPPQCSGVLDSVFWLLPDAIFPHLECMGASGRALYVDFYVFDLFLFPLIYSTALLGLLRRLWPTAKFVHPKAAEALPERWETLENVVSVLTRTKWVVVLSANIFVVVGALKLMVGRADTKSTKSSKDDDTVTTDSTMKFYNIGQISDVFDWLTDTFVPSVFITEDYNGKALTKDLWGRVATVPREPVPSLLRRIPYYNGAKVVSFDTSATDAAGKINALKAQGDWLDFSTKELLITIVTYNGELQGYAVTEMQLTFSKEARSGTQLRRLYRHRRSGIRNLVCGDVWVVIEHSSTVAVVAFYFVWISIVLLMFQKDFRNNLASLVVSGKNWASDVGARDHLYAVIDRLKAVAKLTVALRLIATLAIFLLSLRILKSALHQFSAFFIVFIVIFVTFAVSGTILFGDRVEGFSSLQTAMETCINMLFGNFDYDSIQGLYDPSEQRELQVQYNLAVARIADNMVWTLLLWINDLVLAEVVEDCTPDGETIRHSQLSFAELDRADVVFRGRIRPSLLERGLGAILEQKEATQGGKLTSRMLMEMFPLASIQEGEARATLEYINGEQQDKSADVSDNDEMVRPAPAAYVARQGPSIADTTSCSNTIENADVRQMARQLAALEQKLDLLLSQKL